MSVLLLFTAMGEGLDLKQKKKTEIPRRDAAATMLTLRRFPARQALFLLQQCGHSVEEAMRRTQMNSLQQIDTLSLWSEEECANFENGLRFYGKDFYTIQQQKVGPR